MNSPLAPIESITGVGAAPAASVVPQPNLQGGAADPAAVTAFQDAMRPPLVAHYHAGAPGTSGTPLRNTTLAPDWMRWAEQTQREFASSMQPGSPIDTSNMGAMLQELQRVSLTCVSISLCKNVADQFIQAGQTLLRQQN